MKWQSGIPQEAQREVRRIVVLTRLAGLFVVLSLTAGSVYIHRGALTSSESVFQFATILVGALAFVALSTLARLSHASIIQRSLSAVRSLSDQLREIADRDPLTGLYNLRAFQERLLCDLEEAAVAGACVSLIIADLDNFKLLNDSFGHQYGDEVLRRTARVFERAGSGQSYVARLGGDEFAMVLPGIERTDAVVVARGVESELAQVRTDDRQGQTLGSFGIATYPQDGTTVQALFSAADGRMYSEKHHRKAEALSSLAGASRKLFLSVGASLRASTTAAVTLQAIADATRAQFSLDVARIAVPGTDRYEPMVALAASSHDLLSRCGDGGRIDATALAAMLPAHAWIIESPISPDSSESGTVMLAGLPDESFRPDAPVVLALADLIHAVVASGRAQDDAARAGRERDIHIELAHALAGAGSLQERLSSVVDMVASFVGAVSVTIEALAPERDTVRSYNLLSGAPPDVLTPWQEARTSKQGRAILPALIGRAPFVFVDPADDETVPPAEREIMRAAKINAVAIVAIWLDNEVLGILAAATRDGEAAAEAWLDPLIAIADHLAPVMKVALLGDELQASYVELERASRESLARLADAAEARDPHTGGHLRRIRGYTYALARQLGLSEAECAAIAAASSVHDLGKLHLADDVLKSPGLLDADAWAQMVQHPADGERLIGGSPMFALERSVARWHHERWDGSGYPDGLREEQIPLAARIVAVADAFDALTTVRPYKPAWPLDRAFAEIQRCAGTLFCPSVAQALAALWRSGQLASLLSAADPEHERAGSLAA